MVYKNLIELIGKYGNGLEFERHERYGWLTTNLELLGTGLCCKLCLKLKQSAFDCIRNVCEKSRIKIIPIHITEENEHIIELTNRNTFGMNEFECVKAFYDSVKGIIQTLVKCGLQSDVQNEMLESQKGTENENEIHLETENKSNSPKVCENTSEANDDKNEGDKSVENEQSPDPDDDATKNGENNEQQKGDEDNVQNEPVSNTEKSNVENPSNKENPHRTSESDTDNLDKGEKVNEDTVNETNQNAETIECEAKQNENETDQNQNEINSEKPNDIEDQSTATTAAIDTEKATTAAAATEEGTAATTEQPIEG